MIYKFNSTGRNQLTEYGESLHIQITSGGVGIDIMQDKKSSNIILDDEQLYDLIGALHSIKTKRQKGGQNETN